MRRAAVVGVLVVGALSMSAVATHALLTDAQTVDANTFTVATLQPPTGLSATASCSGLQPRITLSWTATSSTFADGYDVLRSTANGGPYSQIAHVTGRTTTSYVNTGLNLNTTYYYVLRSTYGTWTSANTAQVQATTALICL